MASLRSYQVVLCDTISGEEVCRVTSFGETGHDALLRVAKAITDGTMHAGHPCSEQATRTT